MVGFVSNLWNPWFYPFVVKGKKDSEFGKFSVFGIDSISWKQIKGFVEGIQLWEVCGYMLDVLFLYVCHILMLCQPWQGDSVWKYIQIYSLFVLNWQDKRDSKSANICNWTC